MLETICNHVYHSTSYTHHVEEWRAGVKGSEKEPQIKKYRLENETEAKEIEKCVGEKGK
jgi:hypothetical protein